MHTRRAVKLFFGHNSAAVSPIAVKFCLGKQNNMALAVTRHTLQISKIQDGGQQPFWKSLKTSYLGERLV